ncbi:MAG: CehA/McbA family metallohydrolase [Planctomycetaceae bacterium]|nr:CehA/McbA family metallohydrolase [Planctomycetaceae bacterium]
MNTPAPSSVSRWLLLLAVCLPMACAAILISADAKTPHVELAVLNATNWDRFVPEGKEVDAIYGDAVLRNRHLTAVIANVTPNRNANMTVRDVAGCLIDLTDRDHQSDQLSCFYPGARRYPFRKWTFSDPENTTNGLTMDTEVDGKNLSVSVISEGNGERPTVEVTYSLGENDQFLTMSVRYQNVSEKPIQVDLIDDIRADGGKEDMTKSPNGTTPVFSIEDHFWQQAYGVRCLEHAIQCNSNSRTSTLSYANSDSQTKIEIAPGQSVTRVCQIACGATRMHVTEAFAEPKATPCREVTLVVQDGLKRRMDHARIEVRNKDELLGVAVANRDGEAKLPLPEGDYQLRISQFGVVAEENAPLTVSDVMEQEQDLICVAYKPGTVTVQAKDQSGAHLPCKVEFVAAENHQSPNFGPETAETGVRNLRYSPNGNVVQDLLPGEYQLTISHGPEYDIVQKSVLVASGQNSPIEAVLKRTVDTTGWVSSDFHSHSSPSGDNTASQRGRVLNLVCEHIEFAPCTEHNRIDTYQHHIDALRIGRFLSSTTGMELTGSPLPLNHQNVFPLHHHPHRQDGGGPQTDTDVEKQVQRIAAWDDGSEKLIQQNHPDIGWLVYDKNGDTEPDHGHEAGVALIDVMEIHPIQKLLTLGQVDGVSAADANGNRLFRWLQLLNQGYRIPGVVNTDAHYNFHGSGWLRNWIQSSTDDPAQIDTMEMVHASEEGRIVMSNGPFLKVFAHSPDQDKRVTVGQDLSAPSKQVTLDISVQCPNWLDVDTVFILVNGKANQDLLFTRKEHADQFGDGAMKFQKKVTITLEGDAHLIVGAGDSDSTLEVVYGSQYGNVSPSALSNPIFVDTDGDGFSPNKDTLGLPLPVKGT